MADVVNITSEHNRSDDGNEKEEIASATKEKEIVKLLDDDDDDDEKTRTFCVMKEAYCILPHREDFCCPEGWTLKKFRTCTTMYLQAPHKCFLELDLEIFSNWYAKLPLSKLMDYHKQVDCEEVWEYSVVLLNPKMLVSCPDQSKRNRYNWAKDAVSAFTKILSTTVKRMRLWLMQA
jgi:hypothetical protein